MKTINVLKEFAADVYRYNHRKTNRRAMWYSNEHFTYMLDGFICYRIPSEDVPFMVEERKDDFAGKAFKKFSDLDYQEVKKAVTVDNPDGGKIRIFDNAVGVNEAFFKNFDKNHTVYICTTDETYQPVFVQDSDGLCGLVMPIARRGWEGLL